MTDDKKYSYLKVVCLIMNGEKIPTQLIMNIDIYRFVIFIIDYIDNDCTIPIPFSLHKRIMEEVDIVKSEYKAKYLYKWDINEVVIEWLKI